MSDIARGSEVGAGGTLARKGSDFSGHVNDAHKASKVKIQESIQRVEKGIEKGSGKSVKEISKADKAKLEGWAYPPSKEKYLKYKEVYDNPKYYNQETGDINWPPHNGFEGEPMKMKLEQGTIIDRYGNPNGTFVSPAGIPYEQRALALHSDDAPYHKYEILEEFEVEGGKIAPWFDRPGGGIQYYTGNTKIVDFDTGETFEATVENLLKFGYIREIE
ncbi:glycohydrolase toxin TNT-related protein [Bacillus sp. FSL M8-0168]|uniref:glycohydrolase toxin TNT-related protein n=1 Tax=Bacillus sp. FSL M8-0168 TaxID=2921614 RepID=UPI0030FDD338